jgi:hypothetical protein
MLSPSHASTNKNGTSLLSAPHAYCCYYYYYYMLVSSAFASPACLLACIPMNLASLAKRRVYLTTKCKLKNFTYYLLPAALPAFLPHSRNLSLLSSSVLCCLSLSPPHTRADVCFISRVSAEFPRRAGRFGFLRPLRY